MPSSLLFPLDQLKPTQFLSEYSEWIYFTLILVFFISVAGITLRRHFDKHYIKPLIISVGLMLTVGVFMFKNQLVLIFEGWGILGMVLLVLLVATIPFGLCRGYGMPAKRAAYLTYILIYIVAWFKFPVFFYSLADSNLGLVNLGLMIIFFVAVLKMVPLKSRGNLVEQIVNSSPFKHEIEHDMQIQDTEKKLVKEDGNKLTKFEILTIKDVAETLAEIQHIVESNQNQLSQPEREKISALLQKITKNDEIFKKQLRDLQRIFKQVSPADAKQIEDLKKRMKKASNKNKKILEVELEQQEEKLKIEKAIIDLEERLNQYMGSFNNFLQMAAGVLGKPEHLYEAKDNLGKARVVLKDIKDVLSITQSLEKKLVSHIKAEKKLLKKEKESA